MSVNAFNFNSFSKQILISVIKYPKVVIEQIPLIPIGLCLKFGWFCFFISTLATFGFQLAFSSQLLSDMAENPESVAQAAQMLSSLSAKPLEEISRNFEIIRMSSYFHLLLSPLSSWVFLYLLSGASFAVLNLLSEKKLSLDAYDNVIKFVCIGQAPLLLCVVPLIGPIVGNLWSVWFISLSVGTLFHMNKFLRFGIIACIFLFLFSVWNSTVSMIATAYAKNDSSAQVGSVEGLPGNNTKGKPAQ